MASKALLKKLAERREELSRRGGGLPFFTIKEGTTRMRPLPVGEDEEFAMEVTYFYLNQELGGYISPTTIGKRCALMEANIEMMASANEDDRKFAKEKLRPGKKYFSPHIRYKDTDGKEVDTEAGAKLLVLTGTLYQNMIDFYLDKESGDFTDPINGYDIKYKRTGKGKNDTEYTILPCRPSKLPREFRKTYNTLEMVTALIPTYKETKALLAKVLAMPLEEAEEEAPRRKKKVKRDL